MKFLSYLLHLFVFFIPIESSFGRILESVGGITPVTLLGYIIFILSIPYVFNNWRWLCKSEVPFVLFLMVLGTLPVFISEYGFSRQLWTLWQMSYLYTIIILIANNQEIRKKLVLTFIGGCVITWFIILYQYFSGNIFFIYHIYFERAAGLLGKDVNIVGLTAALAIGYTLSLLKEIKKTFYFIAGILTIAICFLVIIITSSKGAMVAVVVGLVSFVIIELINKKRIRSLSKFIAVSAIIFIIMFSVADYFSDVLLSAKYRWLTASNITELTSNRYDIFIHGLSFIPSNPFGVGYGNSQFLLGPKSPIRSSWKLDAHNVFLKIILEAGWIGFFLLLIILKGTIKSALSEYKKGYIWPIVGLAVLITGMMMLSLDNQKIFWFVLAISKNNRFFGLSCGRK